MTAPVLDEIVIDWPNRLFSGRMKELLDNRPCDCLLLEAGNETWFSNQLAWLLDPKGSHGLGVTFVQKFLEGQGLKNLALSNCAVLREFSLSRPGKNKAVSCDVVVMDLDCRDRLLVIIENKLFTKDRNNQLDTYFDAVRSKFENPKNLRFFYLTLNGDECECASTEDKWIPLSWFEDVFSVLKDCLDSPVRTGKRSGRVQELFDLLQWMRDVHAVLATDQKTVAESKKAMVAEFCEAMIEMGGALLVEELRRRNDGKVGEWRWSPTKNALIHSSYPATELVLGLATGLTVTVHGVKSKKNLFEKILLPLGVAPDQACNLVDIAAIDICHNFFNGTHKEKYVANKRRLTVVPTGSVKEKIKKYLIVVYRYRYALQIITRMGRMK